MEKIVISGSSGFIGSAVVERLSKSGFEVMRLVRKRQDQAQNDIYWNPADKNLDVDLLEGVSVVLNLSGKNIACGRWNAKRKAEIYDSRIQSTELLCDAITKLSQPPKLLISASAIGYYGSNGSALVTEEFPNGKGFLAKTCAGWESRTQVASSKGIRVVLLRFGLVLGVAGGALPMMLRPFRLGLGGSIGSGKQYMSWITIEDVIRVVEYVIREESMRGPVNLVSPNSVQNDDFTKTLGRVLSRPTFCRIPQFAARIALGEMADETVLSSGRVVPNKLIKSTFEFSGVKLEDSLNRMLN